MTTNTLVLSLHIGFDQVQTPRSFLQDNRKVENGHSPRCSPAKSAKRMFVCTIKLPIDEKSPVFTPEFFLIAFGNDLR